MKNGAAALIVALALPFASGVEESICKTSGDKGDSEASEPQRATQESCPNEKALLDPTDIEKYVTALVIPHVLHADKGKASYLEISMRQIEQQVLPDGMPKTRQWAYGLPHDPASYYNPSGTVEVTKDIQTEVLWTNELVQDPATCRCDALNISACSYLPHIIQDGCGVPIVDQTLHWANPGRLCADGEPRTNCMGNTAEPYYGPVPIVPHIHGEYNLVLRSF
jgi:spore coat protein A